MPTLFHRWIRRRSLVIRLTAIGVATSGAVLLIAGVAVGWYETSRARTRLVRDVRALGEVMAANSTAALVFGDESAAERVLHTASGTPHVVGVVLTRANGAVFARYGRDPERPPEAPPAGGPDSADHAFRNGYLLVAVPVVLRSERLGTIHIETDLAELEARGLQIALVGGIVLVGGVALAFPLALVLQRVVSAPVLRLTAVMREVTHGRRYDLRVPAGDAGEIGELARGFNDMLSEIEARDARLREHQAGLQAAVEASTAELRRTNVELTAARDRALRASMAKSQFLANMSHEIRTPMSGLIAATDLALDTSLTREQRDYLVTVRQSAESLLGILNDVLDFSKVERGELELAPVPFDLRPFLARTLRPFAVMADRKGLGLVVRIAPDVPERIRGDAGRIGQVLGNLVSNAVKFTAAGLVRVDVSVRPAPAAQPRLELAVRDTGIGIPRDKHRSIFEPFRQVDGTITRRYGGTGLGLSIARQLARLMGGAVSVESEAGRGSTFRLDLPLEAVAGPPAPPPPTLAGRSVLVAAACPAERGLLVEWLTRRGAAVTAPAASDVRSALVSGAAARRPFAAVFLDAGAPDVDLRDLAGGAGSTPAPARVILLASPKSAPSASAAARELGVGACLVRPLYEEEVAAVLAGVLDGRPPADRGAPHGAGVVPAARRVRVLVVDDVEVNRRLTAVVLQARGHDAMPAGSGAEALDVLDRSPVDVVLMDLQMPDLDGLAVTAEIRRREAGSGRRVPIVAMTAHALAEDRDRCLAAGIEDCLVKPVERDALFRAVESAPAAAPVDLTGAIARAGGDAGLWREIAAVFRQECPARLDAVRHALGCGDAVALRGAAHAVRGMAATLGAPALAAAAAEVEALGRGGTPEGAPAVCRRVEVEGRAVLAVLDTLASVEDPCESWSPKTTA